MINGFWLSGYINNALLLRDFMDRLGADLTSFSIVFVTQRKGYCSKNDIHLAGYF